jgi:hypothetical protein
LIELRLRVRKQGGKRGFETVNRVVLKNRERLFCAWNL